MVRIAAFRHAARAALLLLGAAALPAGCAEPEPAGKSVVLVVVDTLRADRLGCYGNERGLTPRIDALASEGVLFERAYSHAPWTLPSTASLLTSLHPAQHGAGGRVGRFLGLAPEVLTVAEVFRSAGWATGAVVNVDFLARKYGLMQGFDHVDSEWYPSNSQVRRADAVTDAALEWIDQQEGPFFLLVHYFDAHAVYEPPDAYRRRFADARDQEDSSFVFGTRADMLRLRTGQLELDPDVLGRAEKLYDAEVAFVDAEVGRLFDGVAARALEGETVVAFTSDHGEEFLDHGGFEHGHTLFEELVHVPLVLRAPGALQPARVSERVRHVDVAPTLCALAGIEAPQAFVGHDLSAGGDGDVPVLSHGNFWGPPLTGWHSGDRKLILVPSPDGPVPLLFDLARDPGEHANLAGQEPAAVARMIEELELHGQWSRSRADGTAVDLSEEERERLRSLGYLVE